MKLFELYDKPSSKCLIIGGQHGNEPIGVEICQELSKIIPPNNGVHIIPIANRPAFIDKTREFNGVNLNRAYGDQSTNILELDDMVNIIKEKTKQSQLVIDCHSTPITGLDEIAVFPNKCASNIASLMGLPHYYQPAPEHSLRYFCDQHNIPSLTFEGVDEMHDESVEAGVVGIIQLLTVMKIL